MLALGTAKRAHRGADSIASLESRKHVFGKWIVNIVGDRKEPAVESDFTQTRLPDRENPNHRLSVASDRDVQLDRGPSSSGAFKPPIARKLNRGLSGGEARDRDAKRRTRYVIEADFVAKSDG